MRKEDFYYDLPQELIAQQPPQCRGDSRLLQVLSDSLQHRRFDELPALLNAGDLLVVNDTRVIKARLQGEKDSGGRAEILVERIEVDTVALCQVRVSKPLKPGHRIRVADVDLVVIERADEFYRLLFPCPVLDLLAQHGSVPLPPYIARPADAEDEQRYQTVFSKLPGAVAAPTAGLHFTQSLIETLAAQGTQIATVTLHVGAGTFQPPRSNDLSQHTMHSERYFVPAETVAAIQQTVDRSGRVIAVGTTVVRALESAAGAAGGTLSAGWGETDLFILPGFEFQIVDALITNFHLPESTLLMLISAFAGYDRVKHAYQVAVDSGYRFFSYGDAMMLERAASSASWLEGGDR